MSGVKRRTLLSAAGGGTLAAYLLGAGGARPAHAEPIGQLPDEDGYQLWLRYQPVTNLGRRSEYAQLSRVVRQGDTPMLRNAEAELVRGLTGLLGRDVPAAGPPNPGAVVIGTADSPLVRAEIPAAHLASQGPEGYVIRWVRGGCLVVASSGERGVLYGCFHLLRLLQTEQPLAQVDIRERPANPLRLVNHWDNLDRTVERGYAGRSIFHWDDLPTLDARYTDYARALASVGINGTVVNNVNANAQFLASGRIPGLAALAGCLREWGVRFYLSANYASPMVLTAGDADPIRTADPFDARVQDWWRRKIDEIYQAIPDFGGFLVKANSEGQPGPLDYGRTHADGANMLARLVADHDGIIVWRSFVHEGFRDWAEYQHRVFAPLDGDFADNVVVQTKNGPIDFQVREPVNPLFGALPNTNQMLELQITQEYTGHSTHLCYLVPQWKQVLDFDTRAQGKGTTVARIVDGSAYGQTNVGLAGVVNFGDDRDWTGYQLGAANTHGYGRLAWNPRLSAEQVAREWVQMSFGCYPPLVRAVTDVLLTSWRTYEDYTSPLGMGYLTYPLGAHFDPDPRSTLNLSHYTDANGTGFDRTAATGTGYTALYHEYWADRYESLTTVPDELLLFMHKVPYTHRLHSGRTVIQHIYDSHFDGFDRVLAYRQTWRSLSGHVDPRRHADILQTFDEHVAHARLWRDTLVAFFFSYGRILDERRSWLQIDPGDASGLLFGGWPNRLPVEVGNATPQQLTVRCTGVPPGPDWRVSAAEQVIASRQFATLKAPVQPPLVADLVALDFAVEPQVPALGNRARQFVVAPAGRRCLLALDAGTGGSPLVRDYQRLTPTTAWDAERGFGWVGSAPQSRDRGGSWDPLRRDFCGDYPARTLRIRIPAGRHEVAVLVGDGGPDSHPTYITVDGERVAESPFLPGGSFTWVRFPLDGGTGGREVDLTFDSDPDKFWHLCSLVIADAQSQLPKAVVTDVQARSVWFGGQPAEVAVTVANTTGDEPVPVTVEVQAPDGWHAPAVSHVVPAGQEATVRVALTAPPVPAIATLRVQVSAATEVGDARRDLTVVAVPAGDQVPLALDSGSAASPVLAGYRRLAPEDAWDPAKGYGWVGPRPDFRDRNLLDELRRDFTLGRDTPYVLRVAVPPGRHEVHVLTGDAYSPSGTTTVRENSEDLASSGAEIIPQGQFRWFSFWLDGGTDGRTADLELAGSQRDRYWRLVALVMR